jgi:hypothetical protein
MKIAMISFSLPSPSVNFIMSTFQTDFTAAKTAIIKAFEHDYTPHIRALLQVLVEHFQLNVLEPVCHWPHLFELVSDVLRKEPFPYLLMVFFKIHFLAIYIVKKTFDNFMLGVTMAYGSLWDGMSYVLDTPEKTNIAVNVIALNVLVVFSLWLMSLVIGYVVPSGVASTDLTIVERCLAEEFLTGRKSRRQQKRASRRPAKR